MQPNILFVDDDPNVLAGFQRTLRKDFCIETAAGGERALSLCASRPPFAVVVADMQMPGMNGIDFLIQLEKSSPDTVRIMLTGNADQKTARDAVNKGHIFRFLNKPCPPEELIPTLKAGLQQYRLVTAEREVLEQTLNGCVKVLGDVLAMHDSIAFGQGQRLREYMRAFGQSLKLPQTWDLELAASLSQIGCVTIPKVVLEKARGNAPLTGPEKDMLRRVPQIGSEMLIHIPRLDAVARIILYQHKNFDGSGYPADVTAGENIPVGARILRVLHELLQREAARQPREKAFEAMTRTPGLFDPKVLEAVAATFDICLDPVASSDVQGRHVNLKELQIGQVLKAPIQTREGMTIAPGGAPITPVLLEKLRNFAELDQLAEPFEIIDG